MNNLYLQSFPMPRHLSAKKNLMPRTHFEKIIFLTGPKCMEDPVYLLIFVSYQGPKNFSGEWSGVFGNTVTGRHAFALSPWVISKERNRLTDTNVIFGWDRWVLAMNLKSSNDVKVFIRPFAWDSWLAIFSFLGFLLILWSYTLMVDWSNETSRILEFNLLFFFLLIHSYYGSALTGYFATESDVNFKTLEDVLKYIPDWTLIHLSGVSTFERSAKQVSTSLPK